ncbi:MAG: Rossmann-like and DUF2520 domain-containing protein [Calditrichia bacterium]
MDQQNSKPSFFIIGAGRTGASVAFYLTRQGYKINALVERNPQRIDYLMEQFNWSFLLNKIDSQVLKESRIILVTVRDDHLNDMAQELSKINIPWRNKIVVHMSGALPSDVLQPLREKGAHVASVHPVYSFASDPRDNHRMTNIWFNIEGDEPALQLFEKLFAHTENRIFRVDSQQKQAMHIAAVIYANFYVSLAKMSRDLLQDILPAEEDLFLLLNPLLTSSIEQVTRRGIVEGLTGPVTRGDAQTIQNHLDYLREHAPHLVEPYVVLTRQLLPLSGLKNHEKENLKSVLDGALKIIPEVK